MNWYYYAFPFTQVNKEFCTNVDVCSCLYFFLSWNSMFWLPFFVKFQAQHFQKRPPLVALYGNFIYLQCLALLELQFSSKSLNKMLLTLPLPQNLLKTPSWSVLSEIIIYCIRLHSQNDGIRSILYLLKIVLEQAPIIWGWCREIIVEVIL